jgi:hypothetical protein
MNIIVKTIPGPIGNAAKRCSVIGKSVAHIGTWLHLEVCYRRMCFAPSATLVEERLSFVNGKIDAD